MKRHRSPSVVRQAMSKPMQCPTPAELTHLCLEIQSRWTPRERHRRTVSTPPGWHAPVIRVADIAPSRAHIGDVG